MHPAPPGLDREEGVAEVGRVLGLLPRAEQPKAVHAVPKVQDRAERVARVGKGPPKEEAKAKGECGGGQFVYILEGTFVIFAFFSLICPFYPLMKISSTRLFLFCLVHRQGWWP